MNHVCQDNQDDEDPVWGAIPEDWSHSMLDLLSQLRILITQMSQSTTEASVPRRQVTDEVKAHAEDTLAKARHWLAWNYPRSVCFYICDTLSSL